MKSIPGSGLAATSKVLVPAASSASASRRAVPGFSRSAKPKLPVRAAASAGVSDIIEKMTARSTPASRSAWVLEVPTPPSMQ